MLIARLIARMALFGTTAFTLSGCVEGMFFYPDRYQYASPQSLGVRVDDVQMRTADGVRLHGWFLPASAPAKGAVLHLHGNAANVSNHLPLVAWLPARGYHVLMVDYRGFGRSEGKPTLDGIVEDGLAGLATLRSRPEVDAGRIVVLGQSIGGATALRMLARDATGVRLAIIDSAFPSYRGMARAAAAGGPLAPVAALAAATLPGADKDPETALKSITVPLIFIHGKRDSVIPHEMSDALHATAPTTSRLWKIPDADHIMTLSMPGPWREKIVAAMDAAVK